MSGKLSKKTRSGWTLVEMTFVAGVFSVVGIAMGTLFLFSIRGFASMANYAELDKANREALGSLTREIRQAKNVVSVSTNSITIKNGDNLDVTYLFNPTAKEFVRNASDGSHEVLLQNCNLLTFQLYQRNNVSNSFDIITVTTNNWHETVKVIQLSWKTSRKLPNGIANTENIQTARIVIRKQQD
jgi:type II secretory pathway pseudopilin PulG